MSIKHLYDLRGGKRGPLRCTEVVSHIVNVDRFLSIT